MPRLDPKQLAMGVKVEKEHASTVAWLRKHPEASLDDAAARIATDHLKELPDYYTLLDKMERGAKKNNPARTRSIEIWFQDDEAFGDWLMMNELDADIAASGDYGLVTVSRGAYVVGGWVLKGEAVIVSLEAGVEFAATRA